ncbi:MAG TPA: hemerythrin domain-containing protein [Anaerolineales bacterium]|nr:hemerythrin domain-containing protein [Anaerolineales bacterium]
MGKATQDLRAEHEAILNVFRIMDQALVSGAHEADTVLKFGQELVYFLKKFADQCHHGKEENYYFTALAGKGVPEVDGKLTELLAEHGEGRVAIARMNAALASGDAAGFKNAAIQYRDLLVSHIDKENNDLFVKADALLDEGVQEELAEKFESFEEEVIGHGVHEQLHGMIHQWEQQFIGE